MFSDKRCEIKCVFSYVVGIRIMSIHISCDMYLRLGLHVQIRLYCVLPYKVKVSAQHGLGFILDRCIVHLGLTMPNLQKKRLLIFEIFNIKKCTLFLVPSIFSTSSVILQKMKKKTFVIFLHRGHKKCL